MGDSTQRDRWGRSIEVSEDGLAYSIREIPVRFSVAVGVRINMKARTNTPVPLPYFFASLCYFELGMRFAVCVLPCRLPVVFCCCALLVHLTVVNRELLPIRLKIQVALAKHSAMISRRCRIALKFHCRRLTRISTSIN